MSEPEPTSPSSGAIEIVVGSGRRIVVRGGFDRALLRDVVETLESC